MEVPKRLTPTPEVIRRLYLASGNRCAYPRCDQVLMDANAVLVGEIAHIEGALPDSARFNERMSNEERRSFENLLLLCATHHTTIDRDVDRWTTAELKKLKRNHEALHTSNEIHAWPASKDVQLLMPVGLRPARPLHNLPRRPTVPFLGRAAELEMLASAVSASDDGVVQVVHGLSGTGKSELALQYSHVDRDRFIVRWWIAASSADSIEAGLAGLARRINPGASTIQDADLVDWTMGWLQAHSDWLLILDNVQGRDEIEGLLGQLDTGCIIVTSRRDVGWDDVSTQSLRLTVLDDADGAQLIMYRNQQKDQQVFLSLAGELGNLPLALHQASAYLAQTKMPAEKYLAKLRAQPAKVLAVTAHGGPSERAVARVLTITLETISKAEPAAGIVLEILSFFAPDDIPRTWIENVPLPYPVDHVLALLASYNVIRLETHAISTHRLVQVFASEQLRLVDDAEPGAEQMTRELAMEMLYRALPRNHPQQHPSEWPAWTRLSPHAEAFTRRYPEGQAEVTLGLMLGEIGLFHSVQGRYEQALRLQRRSLAMLEETLGPNDAYVAIQLDNIAGTIYTLGDIRGAERLQRRALDIVLTDLEPNHPEVAVRMDNLGATLRTLERFDEAEKLQRQALTIAEAVYGPVHAETAIVLNNLAITLQQAGRAAEAEPLARRALAVNEAIGSDSDAIANNLDNLGLVLASLDRTTEAVPLQRRALSITEALLGPDHHAVAVRLSNLAMTLNKLGESEEAIALQERALAISEATLGAENPEIIVRLANLASTLIRHRDRPDSAIPLLRRALEIDRGSSHHQATNYTDLASQLSLCLIRVGRPEEAEMVARREVEINRGLDDRKNLVHSLSVLGGVLQQLGQFREAVSVLSEAEEVALDAFGQNNETTIFVQRGLAVNWELIEEYEEAIAVRRRAVAGAETLPDTDCEQLQWEMHHLADLLIDDDPQEALALCERALAIAEQKQGSISKARAIALSNLARVVGEVRGHEAAEPLLRDAVTVGQVVYGPSEPEYLLLVANLRDCRAAMGQVEGSS